MKKTRNIVALLVVLILLAGSYVYLEKRPKNQGTQDTPTEEKIKISEIDQKKIVKVVLTSKDGIVTLEKKGDKWEETSSPSAKLNQTAVDDVLSSFAFMEAERLVEKGASDLAKYGLNPPSVTAKAVLDDGSEKVFLLGDKTPTGTYYLMEDKKPDVYVVWMNHGDHFKYTLADLTDKSLPQINAQEITYLKIAPKGERVIEVKANDNENRTEDEQSYGLNAFSLIKPYSKSYDVNSDKFQKVIEGISGLTATSFVAENPSDLSIYGLDKPSLQIVVKDKEKTLDLLFGKDKDDSSIYFKSSDTNTVYTMDKSKLDPFKVTPFDMVTRLASLVNINDVDQITVEANGKKDVMTLSRQTKKAEKADEEDEVITTYKLNGKEVEEKPFKTYYQSLIGISSDAENDKQVENKPEVKVTFTLNKGTKKEMVVGYVPYNADFYAIMIDGKAEFVVSKSQVNTMLNNLDLLAKGELKSE